MTIQFQMLHPRATQDMLGFIPHYFDDRLIGSYTAEQLMIAGYQQTAGCEPNDYFNRVQQFQMREGGVLKFPGDRPMKPIAMYQFGTETLYFYESEMFSIVQPDASFKVWRLD